MIDTMNGIFRLLCGGVIDHNTLDKLKQMAELVGVTYADESRNQIDQTIRCINTCFNYKIKINVGDFLREMNWIKAIEKLVNDRYSDLADGQIKTFMDCSPVNIHGHISNVTFPQTKQTKWQYINLDSLLGIGMLPNSNKGVYKVYTDNTEYRPSADYEVHANITTVSVTKVTIFSVDKKTDVQSSHCSLSFSMTNANY
jgi:hypothetical protein